MRHIENFYDQVMHIPRWTLVPHFQVLRFMYLHFQRPPPRFSEQLS